MRDFLFGSLVADVETIERCAEVAARNLIATFRERFGSEVVASDSLRTPSRSRSWRVVGRSQRW
jgi:hypothetical protein